MIRRLRPQEGPRTPTGECKNVMGRIDRPVGYQLTDSTIVRAIGLEAGTREDS
jgi:hypothetical protein